MARNTTFVVVLGNVVFHHSTAVTNRFAAHPRMSVLFLPPYSHFLNPIEEFFSMWRRKVYDHSSHGQLSLLDVMNAGCGDTSSEACQGWIRYSKRFFPTCIAREDIRCDVDKNVAKCRREGVNMLYIKYCYSFSQLLRHNSWNNSPFSQIFTHNFKNSHPTVQTSNFWVPISFYPQTIHTSCQNTDYMNVCYTLKGLIQHTATKMSRIGFIHSISILSTYTGSALAPTSA